MGRKHYALRAILFILITEAITILPSVLIVPYELLVGRTFYLAPIAGALCFGVAILGVLFGNQISRFENVLRLQLNVKNGEDIKFIPSEWYFVSALLSLVICGIAGTVFNLFPLFSYIP